MFASVPTVTPASGATYLSSLAAAKGNEKYPKILPDNRTATFALRMSILAKHAPPDGLTDRKTLLLFQLLFLEPRIHATGDDPFLQLVAKTGVVIQRNAIGVLTDAQAMDELYGILDGPEANEILAK